MGGRLTPWSAPRGDAVAQPRPLIAAENEQLVLLDRTADDAAELVLVQDLFCRLAGWVIAIVEEIVGVQLRVAEELERRSMKRLLPDLVTTFTLAPGFRP